MGSPPLPPPGGGGGGGGGVAGSVPTFVEQSSCQPPGGSAKILFKKIDIECSMWNNLKDDE
jgi:hypothetical protein